MKDTFATRMGQAVSESGRSLQEIADLAGTSKGQVSQWQTEGKVQVENIKAHVVESICAVLGIRPRWLLYGEGPRNRGGHDVISTSETPPGYVRFDLFDGAAGMGLGVANSDYPEVIRTVDVAEWEIRKKLGFLPAPGRMRLITGRGPSMRPKIEDGDVVMIDTTVTYFDGDDYYLISVDGETQIKMLQKRVDGLYVVSSNPDFREWRINVDDLIVCGKALIGLGLRQL